MNQFGLGLVLSFTDNLSGGVDNAINSINGLVASLERVDDTASTVSLMALCSVAQQVGDTFEDMGSSILGVFSSVFDKVMQTGSMFENYKITLNALYGDANRAQEELNKMFDFAVKSPVDMENVMPYIVKLKTLGLEAFDSVSNKAESTTQNMINWVTDFMSVAGGMGASSDRISRAVINFLNPQNTRSLMMMRNIFGDIEGLIESQGDTLGDTIEARVQNLTSIITALGANGITESMMGTWSTLLSNMEDVFMQFWLGIADGGAFDSVKASLMEIVGALNQVDTTKFGQVLADGLKIITVPLQTLAHWLSKAIIGFTDFATAHPFLTKLVISMTAVLGVSLLLSGIILKLGAQFGMMAIGINLARGALADLSTTGVLSQFTGLGNKIKWLSLGLTALYVMWNKDFGGIKTKTIAFVNNVKSSFSQARSIVSMNCNEMKKAIDALDSDNPFDNFTKGLVKIGVLIGAVKEGLSNRGADGSFILSADTYSKLCALGLEGLVGRIFDAVYAFEKFIGGFKKGWQTASEAVANFLSGIRVSIKGTFLDTIITKVADFADKLDFDREKVFGFFETMGEYTGKITPLILAFIGLKTALGGLGKVFGVLNGGGLLSGLFGTLGSGLSSLAPTLAGGISSALGMAFKMFNPANILGYATSAMIKLFSSAFNGISSIVESLINSLFNIGFTGLKINTSSFGALGEGFSTVIKGIIEAPIKGLLKVFSGLGGKLVAFVSNPVTIIIGILTAVGTAFGQAYEKLDGFKEWVNNALGLTEDLDFSTMFDGLMAGLGGMMENLKTTFGNIFSLSWLFDGLDLKGGEGVFASLADTNGLMSAVSDLFGGGDFDLGAILGDIKNTFLEFWDSISPILAYIGVVLADLAQVVWDVIGVVGEVIGILSTTIAPVLQGTISEIVIVFKSAWEVVKGIIGVITGAVNVVVGIIQGIYGIFKGIATNDWSTMFNGFGKAWDGVKGIFEGVKGIFGGIFDFLMGTVGNFINIGVNIIDGLIGGVKSAWSSITEVFKNLGNHIIQFVKDLFGIHSPSTIFADIGSFLIQGLIQGVQNMISFVVNVFQSVVDVIKGAFNGVIEFFSSIGSSIAEFFSNGFQLAYDLVTNIFSGFIDFFSGIWTAITGLFSGDLSPAQFFSTIFQEAYDLVTGIFSSLGEFFSGVWQSIVDLFNDIGTTVGEAVSSTVGKAIDAVLSTAVSIINGFISAINTAIGVINEIPGVSISKLDKLSVPEMATGGVVDKATLAVVGEAGKEAVMPLENNTGWINELAGKIGSYMGVGASSDSSNGFIHAIGEFASTMTTFMQGIMSAGSGANEVSGLTTIINKGDNSTSTTTITPVTRNESTYGGNTYNSSTSTSSYITRNTNTTNGGNVDNSITFGAGSIVIQANGCSDAEAERLATLIMKKIERKGQISNLTNYRSIAE